MSGKEQFGTTEAYVNAFDALLKEGVPDKHLALLREHFAAPRHTATAQQLATRVGYANFRAVNLQYGTLARRVATLLGVQAPPRNFWLFVLVNWATRQDPHEDTRFVLRKPVVEALKRLGMVNEGLPRSIPPVPAQANRDPDEPR